MKKFTKMGLLCTMLLGFLAVSTTNVLGVSETNKDEINNVLEEKTEENVVENSSSVSSEILESEVQTETTQTSTEETITTSEKDVINDEKDNKKTELLKSDEVNDSQVYDKYVTVINEKAITYQNFSGKMLMDTKSIYGKTFYAKEKYEQVNGKIYLSLFDNKDKWYGYIESSLVEVGDGRQGAYQTYWKYITITSKNYEIFDNFSWNNVNETKNVLGVTYQARGRYQHFNGSTYLSLYDNAGNWQGYVNENAAKVGAGRQGIYQTDGRYVTITSKNYETYRNFSWLKLSDTKNIYGKTYLAKGKYQHLNGSTYLSIFDNAGNWYGYVNEKATKTGNGRQGIYQTHNKYVTVTSPNYETYKNFSWNKLNVTKNFVGKTYEARGKYQHFNGSTYLSIFDHSGNWQGYVNEKATQTGNGREGIYQNLNRHVIISSKNYDMWRNFNWDVKQPSANLYKKGFIAKGKYVHFNGSTYYSIYDGNGNWQGYINSGGTSIVSYKDNPTTYYSQMAVGAWNGCAATSLYTALRAKGYAGNVTLVDFINGLPLSENNPDVGQIGNPWGTTTFVRVISPIGLNNYAKKYTSTSEVITGSSTDKVITEINSGNYVLYWGEFAMRQPDVLKNPQHVMIARGYKVVNGKEYILIQDPGMYSLADSRAVVWYEKTAFDNYIAKKYRKMMVVR